MRQTLAVEVMEASKKRRIIHASLREGHSNNSTIRFLQDVLDNDEDVPKSWKDLITSAGRHSIVLLLSPRYSTLLLHSLQHIVRKYVVAH